MPQGRRHKVVATHKAKQSCRLRKYPSRQPIEGGHQEAPKRLKIKGDGEDEEEGEGECNVSVTSNGGVCAVVVVDEPVDAL